MHGIPNLVSVRIIPWEMNGDLFGIACEYDDGIEVREVWGTYEQTLIAATLRQRDIISGFAESAHVLSTKSTKGSRR
jgi:hypothetical protein